MQPTDLAKSAFFRIKKKLKTSQAHSLSLKRKQPVPNRRKSPPLLVLPVNLWVNTRHVHLSAHYRKAMMKMLILKVSKSSQSIFDACVPKNNYKLQSYKFYAISHILCQRSVSGLFNFSTIPNVLELLFLGKNAPYSSF